METIKLDLYKKINKIVVDSVAKKNYDVLNKVIIAKGIDLSDLSKFSIKFKNNTYYYYYDKEFLFKRIEIIDLSNCSLIVEFEFEE